MSTGPTYRDLLRTPRIIHSFLPSIVGRLSLATSGLALVLLLEEATGSFTIAGAVTAALGIANVFATPWRSRLIDRHGQLRVLSALGAVHAVSLVALGLIADVAVPSLLALAILAGASSPPFGATMRVVWSAAVPSGPGRTRAYSLDAVAEEVTFAAGPLMAAILAATAGPFAALLLSAACMILGTTVFVLSSLSREQHGSRRSSAASERAANPLRAPGFPPVVLVMVVPGLILGAIELAAPALSVEASAPVLAGVLLALFAGASAVGGLVYGRLLTGRPLIQQLIALIIVLLVVTGATGAIGGTFAAVIGFTLGGLCLAPILVVGYLSADALTHAQVRTEANSWINTAVNLGAALGALIFGSFSDASSPAWALTATAVMAAVLLVVATPFLSRRSDVDE